MVEASLSTRQVRVAKLLLLLVFVVVGWGVAPAQEPCEQEVSQLNPAQMQCPPGIPAGSVNI